MRLFIVAIIAISAASYASAGISYYSNVTNGNNNGSAFSYTFNAAGATWNPLIGTNSGGGIAFSSPGSRISMTGNGQPGSFETVFSVSSFPDSLTSVSASSSVTFNGATSQFSVAGSPVEGAATVHAIDLSASADSYFVWAHFDTSDNSTYAIGWAKYTSPGRTDAGDNNLSGDVFTISEWAYNLTSSYSSIVVGDTNGGTSDLNFDPGSGGGGSVPEPTGMAILGLAATVLCCTRKRVR